VRTDKSVLASGYVALRLPPPGSVVTWFVTGSRNSVWLPEIRMSRLLSAQARRIVPRQLTAHRDGG
jgi:hypothetical protein